MKRIIVLLFTCLFLLLAACDGGEALPEATVPPPTAVAQTEPTVAPTPIPPTNTPQPQPTNTPEPTNNPEPTSTPQPTNTPPPSLPALPPEAQRIEFQAEDGVALVGYYFPAAVNPAPLIVLMHWAGGDQTDWQHMGMVSWLQNRGLEIPAPPAAKPFDTPYPLTPLPAGQSYGVFTFDFRGFGESGAGAFADTVQDARAAYAIAATLPGVDPARIAGIGASIGAIQVINGCQEDCQGALSIGPQNLLAGFVYATAVADLEATNKPAWCIAAADMEVDYEACSAAAGALHRQQIYPEGGHAMQLFRTELGLDPPLEQVILDFLQAVFNK
jgi:pimeloyl-ACP methyl ester carboxylesterase